MPEEDRLAKRIAACAGLAAFVYQFENCVTATALPVMCGEVKGLAGVVSLVPAAYLVGATVAMVPAGRWAMRVGFHRVLAAALGLMALGAAICSVAPNAPALIAGRLLEGLGGGALASAAYGLVAVGVAPERRRGVLGVVSGAAGLGMVLGTPLGGAVAEWYSWRVLFAGQIPLLVVAGLVMLVRKFEGAAVRWPMGWGRSLLLGAGSLCACVAGSLGRERGWLSPEILGLQAGAVGIFAIFLWSERGAEEPLFPREIWRAGEFWRAWGLLFACAMALGGTFFLVPFYLHEVLNLSPAVSASWMVVQVVFYSLAALSAGRLQGKLATEQQAMLGAGLALVGVAMLGYGLAGGGFWGVAIACALIGAGFGLTFPAVNAACVGRLPEAQRGQGAALLPLGLNLGSVVGVIAVAEVREWHLDEAPPLDYRGAFLVVLAVLVVAELGLVRLAARTKKKS